MERLTQQLPDPPGGAQVWALPLEPKLQEQLLPVLHAKAPHSQPVLPSTHRPPPTAATEQSGPLEVSAGVHVQWVPPERSVQDAWGRAVPMQAAPHDFWMQARTTPSTPLSLLLVMYAQALASPATQPPMSRCTSVLLLHEESPQHWSSALLQASYTQVAQSFFFSRATAQLHSAATAPDVHCSLHCWTTHLRMVSAGPYWVLVSPFAQSPVWPWPHLSTVSRKAEE